MEQVEVIVVVSLHFFIDSLRNLHYAEQKVKVPPLHCDSRVKTISADVMSLPKQQVRALSPKVLV